MSRCLWRSALLLVGMGLVSLVSGTDSGEWYEVHYDGWFHYFMSSIAMVMCSEIGDKTFLIAAIMSMKVSKVAVFLGSISALIIMSMISVVIGAFLLNTIPLLYTKIFSALLFLIFGLIMLVDGITMDRKTQHNDICNLIDNRSGIDLGHENEDQDDEKNEGAGTSSSVKNRVVSPGGIKIFVEVFVLTFLAEWGDRSQVATAALAASKKQHHLFWIAAGSIVGHVICAFLAVMCGKFISTKVSVKLVTVCGSILFFIFFIVTVMEVSSL